MPVSDYPPGDHVLRLWQDLADTDMLPPQWLEDTVRHVTPLAVDIAGLHTRQQQPLVVGINGAQGTGKSTLAKALALMLENTFHLKTTVLSLDDFYLSHASRQHLGQSVHPLLVTRGVPGTHDVPLALDTLQRLRDRNDEVYLPGFDKARDDRIAEADCRHARAPRDIIILEGWCIGAQPQTETELTEPANALERNEDSDGRWRRYVNACLAGDYQDLFAAIDYLIMLQAPSFESVLAWRSLQERKLAATLTGHRPSATKIMTPDAIRRFIQHYERLTRHCMATLPAQADAVLYLDTDHRMHSCAPEIH